MLLHVLSHPQRGLGHAERFNCMVSVLPLSMHTQRSILVDGIESDGCAHLSLVATKTKFPPLICLTTEVGVVWHIHPTKLIEHVRSTLIIPIEDNSVVLNWLHSTPCRFKTYVRNWISFILDHIPPGRWKYMYVPGDQDPADCVKWHARMS